MGRYRFVAGGLVIAGGIAFLIVTGVRQSASAHTTLAALLAAEQPATAAPRRLQLGGSSVVPGSIVWGQYRSRPSFTLTDGVHTLKAQYVGNGTLPDTFQDRATVVLEGRYDAAGQVFYAETVYAKCPSKYEGRSYEEHVNAHGEG
jgi:cytochrome c-type biogenesis protein CcmE